MKRSLEAAPAGEVDVEDEEEEEAEGFQPKCSAPGLLSRARSLRALLLPERVKRPPQLAAVLFGDLEGRGPLSADERAAWGLPRRGGLALPEPPAALAARLRAAELAPGAPLVARTGADPKNTEAHCEALLLDRLRGESPDTLASLGTLLLYSFLCPCPSCAAKIADFARERPGLRVELAYQRHFIPPAAAKFRGGISDASSVAALRAAGVAVLRLEAAGGRGGAAGEAEAADLVRPADQ